MTEQEWRAIMESARLAARVYGQRIRVVAVPSSPRARRITGQEWSYVWQVPAGVDQ